MTFLFWKIPLAVQLLLVLANAVVTTSDNMIALHELLVLDKLCLTACSPWR
jgi:hypothetical protein